MGKKITNDREDRYQVERNRGEFALRTMLHIPQFHIMRRIHRPDGLTSMRSRLLVLHRSVLHKDALKRWLNGVAERLSLLLLSLLNLLCLLCLLLLVQGKVWILYARHVLLLLLFSLLIVSISPPQHHWQPYWQDELAWALLVASALRHIDYYYSLNSLVS